MQHDIGRAETEIARRDTAAKDHEHLARIGIDPWRPDDQVPPTVRAQRPLVE